MEVSRFSDIVVLSRQGSWTARRVVGATASAGLRGPEPCHPGRSEAESRDVAAQEIHCFRTARRAEPEERVLPNGL